MNGEDKAFKGGIFYISAYRWAQVDQGSGPLLLLSIWMDNNIPQDLGRTSVERRSAELIFELQREQPATVQFTEYPNGHLIFRAPKAVYLAKSASALRTRCPILGISVNNSGVITNFEFNGVNTLAGEEV